MEITKEKLIELKAQKLSNVEIGKLFNTSHASIFRRCQKFGLCKQEEEDERDDGMSGEYFNVENFKEKYYNY